MSRFHGALILLVTLPTALSIQIEDSRLETAWDYAHRHGEELSTMAAGSCLGDLCVPHRRDDWYFQPTDGPIQLRSAQSGERNTTEGAETPACPAELPANAKVMLMLAVPAYQGSTALESMFMSSDKVTTLCSAGMWQCEARLDKAASQKGFISTDILPRYAQYWNMSKDILLDKGPRTYEKVITECPELQREIQEDPQYLHQYGIQNLQLAYVLMWRPLCLALLSKHGHSDLWRNPRDFGLKELQRLENLVNTHKYLLSQRIPVIVTNLADMIWKTEYSKTRLEAFLPCVAPLDFGYVPLEGKDYFPANQWKVQGSIKSFGDSVTPWFPCNYDLQQSRCLSEGQGHYPFSLISSEDRARAQAATEYLQSRS